MCGAVSAPVLSKSKRTVIPMKILIVTPTQREAWSGNQATADRWRGILRDLGHEVDVAGQFQSQACDVLIALHARRSAESVEKFHETYPDRPLIVVLTGTDLYRDIRVDAGSQKSIRLAGRLIVLQARGVEELPQPYREKARVIYQSAEPPDRRVNPPSDRFRICVIGHLRSEKDPMRTALASRSLPATSRVEIIHVGAALTPDFEKEARAEMEKNPRYCWVGPLPPEEARALLSG